MANLKNEVDLTHTEENYLKTMYALGGHQAFFTNQELAQAIGIKASSVTDMLKKMCTKKWVQYTPYKGAMLTILGKKYAVQVIRKHRLWETFLHTKLGFKWDEVHSIAEQLEHINNTELIDRLDAYLGNPSTDPHGDTIPSKEGTFKKEKMQPLVQGQVGVMYTVKAVHSHEQGMLQLLSYYHIALESTLTIKQQFEYDHSLEVLVNGNHLHVLPKAIISHIMVA